MNDPHPEIRIHDPDDTPANVGHLQTIHAHIHLVHGLLDARADERIAEAIEEIRAAAGLDE